MLVLTVLVTGVLLGNSSILMGGPNGAQLQSEEAPPPPYIGSAKTIAHATNESQLIVVARVDDAGVISPDADSIFYDGIRLAIAIFLKGESDKGITVTAIASRKIGEKPEIVPKHGETAIFFLSNDLKVVKIVADSESNRKRIQSLTRKVK